MIQIYLTSINHYGLHLQSFVENEDRNKTRNQTKEHIIEEETTRQGVPMGGHLMLCMRQPS